MTRRRGPHGEPPQAPHLHEARHNGTVTVYADTPRWPRHGLLWGHLVSDSSLEELHRVAASAGLHPRSFDLDHYDWPASARDGLERAAVTFVGNKELTRILRASGLRIPAVRRPASKALRTTEAARALGCAADAVPTDLIWGMSGHVDPLPAPPDAPPGSFRLDVQPAEPGRPGHRQIHVEAHDDAGRLAADAFLDAADAAARAAGYDGFVGQALQLGRH
jgi:hypothetical protein